MFTRIQTSGYRCLRGIDLGLSPFQALVGPNASGKTTFLDVFTLLGDLMLFRGEIDKAIVGRSPTFDDLLWNREGQKFEIAVEANLPVSVRKKLGEDFRGLDTLRYEIAIGVAEANGEIEIQAENLWIQNAPKTAVRQLEIFPSPGLAVPLSTAARSKPSKSARALLKKTRGGNDNYYPEGKQTYNPSFRVGPGRSALANLPADESSFPAATWFRGLLESRIQPFALNSLVIRNPSRPNLGRQFRPDGSNLPWVVESLRTESPEMFIRWLKHVQTALEDIKDIRTEEKPEDKHRYLVIDYSTGISVPSWLASDGTLRLLALTIPAYLADQDGVWLIEEPENGIHPKAVETVIQSLTSMYGSQVLMATHSPLVLGIIQPEQLLCFSKDAEGATDIISGDQHPALRRWKEEKPDLGWIFAAGVLS